MDRGTFTPFLTAALALVPTIAAAHPGPSDAHDVVHGFMHPLGGIDHVLAMVAVGILAAQLGGRALWLVPASFVLTMAAAGLLGMAGVTFPFVEVGIALSVTALGAIIAVRVDLPLAAATAIVAVFAVFHGYAHGADMPETLSGLFYGFGFVAATIALHAVGIGLGSLARSPRIAQIGGAVIAVAGVAILTHLA
jgi:urease accessory protein